MLDVIFGNKNVEKVLLFLFVNGKCYGTQLHRIFNKPLTPFQKVFARLEKGEVLISYYEGKTRIYRLNPGYPFIGELEQLLRKAYTLLPSNEKLLYHRAIDNLHASKGVSKDSSYTLLEFWEKLARVTRLTFNAHSKSEEELGWNGRGSGEVTVTKTGSNILIFHEKGIWNGKSGHESNFSNIFRWTLDSSAGVIALEHLRRGAENPVFLFHLAPTALHSLTSINSHLCNGDSYLGQARFDHRSLKLTWRVIGPKKNEEIDYCYV